MSPIRFQNMFVRETDPDLSGAASAIVVVASVKSPEFIQVYSEKSIFSTLPFILHNHSH